MAEVVQAPKPVMVELHPVADIPPEYCEYLPKAEFEKCLPWLTTNKDAAWLQVILHKYLRKLRLDLWLLCTALQYFQQCSQQPDEYFNWCANLIRPEEFRNFWAIQPFW